MIKINVREIPAVEAKSLAAATLKATEEFFDSPANREAFAAWVKEEEAKEETA